MADLSDGANWSELDANNNKASPNGWPEGMMPSGVNDSARNDKGALKRFWDRINPVQVITPASGVWTFATTNPTYPGAYVQGEVFTFHPGADSAAGDQFQINSLLAKPIYTRNVAAGGWSAIAAHQITAGQPAQLAYDSSLNAGAGGFVLVNPYLGIQSDGAGGITANGLIQSTGSAAGLTFQARDNTAQTWLWYAAGNAARLTLGGADRANIDTSGNMNLAVGLTAGGNINTGGYVHASGSRILSIGNNNNPAVAAWDLNGAGYAAGFWVNAGRLYLGGMDGNGTPTASYAYFDSTNLNVGGALTAGGLLTAPDAHLTVATIGGSTLTSGNISASGTVSCGTLSAAGMTWTNSGGWMYTPNSLRVGGGLQVDHPNGLNVANGPVSAATSLNVAGCSWTNSGGWWTTSQPIHTLSALQADGSAAIGSNVTVGNDAAAGGVFRRNGSPRGARIECCGGGVWDWVSFTAVSGGAWQLYVSPDSNSSGMILFADTTFSDARLKSDIRPSEVDALAAVLATPVRAFTWNDQGLKRLSPDASPSVDVGLVADEVEEVMPSAIWRDRDDMRHINDQHLVPYLIRALQQLAARLETLEAKCST